MANVCANAIADGLISCVVVDASTGQSQAGADQGGLAASAALFEILDRMTPVRSSESASADMPVRQLLIVGAEQTAFACVTSSHKWWVLLVAPSSFSVALGWSWLRRVADAAEAST